MARKRYPSILNDIKKGAAKLQAEQNRIDKLNEAAIKEQLGKVFHKNDLRFLTPEGKERRGALASEIGHTAAYKYTSMIREKFDELGIPYLPFMLNYIETEKDANVYGKKIKIPKHNYTLGIDYDFVRGVNSRKVSYHTWLIRKDPELGRRYYREVIRGLSRKDKYTSTPQWEAGGRLWKQYRKEVPAKDRALDFLDTKASGTVKKGYIKGEFVIANMSPEHHVLSKIERLKKTNYSKYNKRPVKDRYYPKGYIYPAGDTMRVNMENIDKFIENERYIFGGNLNKFLTSKLGTSEYEIINDILVDVLSKFKEDLEVMSSYFTEGYWEHLARHPDANPRTGRAPKYKHDAKTKSKWKYKPKFPNIESILWWFLNEGGMAKSTKLHQYHKAKSIKAKANWINRSIFLLANGVYARKLGHTKGKTPTGRDKKYGKAATLKKAKRYKLYNKANKSKITRAPSKSDWRTINMADWRKITYTAARGMKNRKNDPSNRKDYRKDKR